MDLKADETALTSHTNNVTIHITAAERTAWNNKSNFSGNYNDLTNKPTIPSAYVHPSSHAATMITEDATHRFVTDTEKSTWNAKSNFSGSYNDLSDKPTIPSAYVHPSSHTATMITEDSTHRFVTDTEKSTWNAKSNFSGSYNDLSDKPTIPSAYVHPSSHTATMITEDSTHRFVTDTEKSTWNNKSDLILGTTSSTAFRGDQGNTAYTHSQAAHAPANAQANADITKEEIEAKLTGNIISHTHSQYIDDTELGTKVLTKDNTTEYTPTGDYNPVTKKYVDDKFIDPDQWIVKTSDNLVSSPITITPSSNIASNKVMVFSAQVGNNFESLTLGHGETSYGSTYITIDNTNVTVYEYYSALQTYKTYAHGLTISGFLDVIIDTNSKEEAVITINTSTGMKKENVMRWIGCNGNIFAKCTNSDLTNCSLRWTCKEFSNDIQIYGDSYASMYTNRSIYRLVEWGYDSFLLDAFSGRGSAAALDSLRINLQYSKPKYIVWMMGMNDPDSTTAINASWQNTINSVISICQEKGIELILTTIPNVRGGAVDDSQIEATIRRHNFKNDYIRNSGYRYIDCALAVGADENGNWYSNMLYTDGVHPADAGAVAMASRIVQDFPEITLGISGGGGAIYDDTGVKASIKTLNDKVRGHIEPKDTTFFDIEPTKNLVNEETLQSGYINASGDIYESASYVYTDYLKVTPGKYIVSTWLNTNNNTRYTGNLRFVTIFNSNKEVVSSLGTNTESSRFLVPEGAAYARVTLYATNLNKLMIELTNDGTSSGVYEPFVGKAVLNPNYLNKVTLKDTTFYTLAPTKNLVDESALQSGYIHNNGTVYSSSSYVYTDFFKVTPGKYIVASWLNTNNNTRYVASMRFIAIYDANKNVVANLGASAGTERFLVPDGAAYARVSLPSDRVNKVMVELTDDGNMTADYAPFEGPAVVGIDYIPSDIARVDNVLSKTNDTEYTPTADYNPATKKYVDDAIQDLGTYSMQYNETNDRLEFVYTPKDIQ